MNELPNGKCETLRTLFQTRASTSQNKNSAEEVYSLYNSILLSVSSSELTQKCMSVVTFPPLDTHARQIVWSLRMLNTLGYVFSYHTVSLFSTNSEVSTSNRKRQVTPPYKGFFRLVQHGGRYKVPAAFSLKRLKLLQSNLVH